MSRLHWANVQKSAAPTAAAGDLHSDVWFTDPASGTTDTRALAPPSESYSTRTHTRAAAAASHKTNGTAACDNISPLSANPGRKRTRDKGRSYPGRVRRTTALCHEHITPRHVSLDLIRRRNLPTSPLSAALQAARVTLHYCLWSPNRCAAYWEISAVLCVV